MIKLNDLTPSALTKMLELEKSSEKFSYKIERDMPLSSLIENADVLGPLIMIEKLSFNRYMFSCKASYSRFRVGESVEIRVKVPNQDSSNHFSYNWTIDSINFIKPGELVVTVSSKTPVPFEANVEYFFFKSSTVIFKNILLKRLNDVVQNEKVILGEGVFNLKIGADKFKELFEKLNDKQKEAINYLINYNLSGAIQGPPGTGKTQLLNTVVALAVNSNMKVGITSFTNTAVDNLLGKISINDITDDWFRIGNIGRVNQGFYPASLDPNDFTTANFPNEDEEFKIVGSTLHKLAFKKSPLKFDLLVIDEAGQVPTYFLPFIQRLAKRVILVGDQFQLPPVLSTNHNYLPADNIFSLFLDQSTPMLETQYRMRKEIQAWSSEKFYKGRLRPHHTNANRDYFDGNYAFFMDSYVESEEFRSKSNSKVSKPEAEFILDKVKGLIKSGTPLETVGIICPYRSQAGLVNATLQESLGSEKAAKILVDTVERFQGQEKEAIFFSLGNTIGSPEDLRFLSNSKRLNVSITRAKSRFFCLYDSNIFLNSGSYKSQDLNEFLRWVRKENVKIRKAA